MRGICINSVALHRRQIPHTMISKSTLLHLRVLFSIFLLPVFLFAFSQVPGAEWHDLIISFIAIHLFLYPSSNGFNSYYDRDEDSIGGLETPPPVTPDLLWFSLLLDAVALALGLLINIPFVLMLLGYGLFSKAYSHPAIRLKKMPWTGALSVAFFQGAFTVWMAASALAQDGWLWAKEPRLLFAGALASVMLLGSYPITQVYQHQEDNRRGDITLSLLLGIRGTFVWTAIVFAMAVVGYFMFFKTYYSVDIFLIFLVFLLPVLFYYFRWMIKAWKDQNQVSYRRTMRLNLLSSVCLALFFVFLIWLGR